MDPSENAGMDQAREFVVALRRKADRIGSEVVGHGSAVHTLQPFRAGWVVSRVNRRYCTYLRSAPYGPRRALLRCRIRPANCGQLRLIYERDRVPLVGRMCPSMLSF